jgi:hypothetical protein
MFLPVPVLSNGGVFLADSPFSCPRKLAFERLDICPITETASMLRYRKMAAHLCNDNPVVFNPILACAVYHDKRPPISYLARAAMSGSSCLSFIIPEITFYSGRSVPPGTYTFRIATSDKEVMCNGMRSGITREQAETGWDLWNTMVEKDQIPPIPAFLKESVCIRCNYKSTCDRINNHQADALSNVGEML